MPNLREMSEMKLFHRVCRDDFDAGDTDPFEWLTVFTAAASAHRRAGDFFQHVFAFDDLAKRRVLAVKKRRVAVANEKLRASGIGIRAARHGKNARLM